MLKLCTLPLSAKEASNPGASSKLTGHRASLSSLLTSQGTEVTAPPTMIPRPPCRAMTIRFLTDGYFDIVSFVIDFIPSNSDIIRSSQHEMTHIVRKWELSRQYLVDSMEKSR